MRTLLILALIVPAAASRGADAPAVPVARLAYVEAAVDRQVGRGKWSNVAEGELMRTGDRVRTGPLAVARIAFPWMSVAVAPRSVVSIPASAVLSVTLESGRAQLVASEGDIIKLRTDELELRGGGNVVVRRDGVTTLVTVLSGSFRVIAGDRTALISAPPQIAMLDAGKAAVVRPNTRLAIETPPAAPDGLMPSSDPMYVKPGEPAALSWSSTGARYHLQVLGIDSEEAWLERDVDGSSASVPIPWPGTFRWRVASRDGRGLEGLPSAEGLVCVVEY